jgi:hypothetical protein
MIVAPYRYGNVPNSTKRIVNVAPMVMEMVKMYPTKRMDLQPLKLHLRIEPVKARKHDPAAPQS